NKLGRKTNAQLYIRFGTGVPQVGKMLGHEEGSDATHNYFNVNLLEIIEATKDIDFEKMGLGCRYPGDVQELRRQMGLSKIAIQTFQCNSGFNDDGSLLLMSHYKKPALPAKR